jgi:preprotein translocase subunit SecA
VVTIPTNRPIIRQDNEDRVYRKEGEKWEAIIDEIKEVSDAGRPVLVGTTSVEKSEMLSNMLKRKYGIEHEVLNAKQHEREAQIVALAGQQHKNAHGEVVGNVTIATNMAGRGTDIKPAQKPSSTCKTLADGKFADPADRQKASKSSPTIRTHPLNSPSAKAVGGLHVIGTERHTARRIDNQLRGRSGRQGDPGSSRFYISLEDELMKMFAGEWTIKVLGWLGMEEGMAIEDKRITKGIIKAQKKVEERNFLQRKNLLEYDEVMDSSARPSTACASACWKGREVDPVIWGMIGDAITDAVDEIHHQGFCGGHHRRMGANQFRREHRRGDLRGNRDIEDLELYIKDQARAEAETSITSTLGEFMGEDETNAELWDAKSLSSWAMSRFQVTLPQNQIRKMKRARRLGADQIPRAAVRGKGAFGLGERQVRSGDRAQGDVRRRGHAQPQERRGDRGDHRDAGAGCVCPAGN